MDAVGARAIPAATAPANATDMSAIRICDMTSFSGCFFGGLEDQQYGGMVPACKRRPSREPESSPTGASSNLGRSPHGCFAPSGLELGQLQQCAIADPGLRELRFRLAGCVGVAACPVKLGEPVVGPSVVRRAFESAPELILRLVEPARLNQRGAKRLAYRIIPVWRLHVGEPVLERRRLLEPCDCRFGIAPRLGHAALHHGS